MNFSGDFSVFYPRNSILNFTFFFTCLKIKNPLFVEILGGEGGVGFELGSSLSSREYPWIYVSMLIFAQV